MNLLRRDQAHCFVTDTLIKNIDIVCAVKGISKKTKIFLGCGGTGYSVRLIQADSFFPNGNRRLHKQWDAYLNAMGSDRHPIVCCKFNWCVCCKFKYNILSVLFCFVLLFIHILLSRTVEQVLCEHILYIRLMKQRIFIKQQNMH